MNAIDRAVAEMENVAIDIKQEQVDRREAYDSGDKVDGPVCSEETASGYADQIEQLKTGS